MRSMVEGLLLITKGPSTTRFARGLHGQVAASPGHGFGSWGEPNLPILQLQGRMGDLDLLPSRFDGPPGPRGLPLTAAEIAVEIAGWTGAGLILLAYLLLSMGRLTGQSALYQGMNLAGAAGFILNGWWHGALPSASLNLIWLLIAAVALWRIRAHGRVEGKQA